MLRHNRTLLCRLHRLGTPLVWASVLTMGRLYAADHAPAAKPARGRPLLAECAALAKDPGPAKRRAAAEACGRLRDDGIPLLAELLADRDESVREAARAALVKLDLLAIWHLPKTKAAVPVFLDMARDRQNVFREQAAEALGQIGPDAAAAVPVLAEMLRDRSEPGYKSIAAARALAKIGPAAVGALAAALADRDKYTREYALTGVRELGPGCVPAMPAIVALLREDDWRLRAEATAILEAAGSAAKAAVPALEALLRDGPSQARIAAVDALVRIKAAVSVPAITALLRDEDAAVRIAAVDALVRIEAAASVPAITALLRDKDAAVRAAATRALAGMLPVKTALPAISALLSDESPRVRLAVAAALRTMDAADEPILAVLAELARHKDAYVREEAARVLGLPGPAASGAAVLLRRLLADQKPLVRLAAAMSLRELDGDPEVAAATIVALLGDKDDAVRLSTVQAVGGGPVPKQVVAKLAELLADEDPCVCVYSATVLAQTGPEIAAAAPVLAELLAGEDESVRRRAGRMLQEIKTDAEEKEATGRLLEELHRRPRPAPRLGYTVEPLFEHGHIVDLDLTYQDEVDESCEPCPTTSTITDEHLRLIGRLSRLESLELCDSLATDAGLAQLASLRRLRQLRLTQNARISQGGLRHLAALPGLKSLTLSLSGPLTAEGLQTIAALGSLRSLDLDCPAHGDEAASHLARARNLSTLRLGPAAVSDKGLRAVAGLGKLVELALVYEPAGPADLAPLGRLAELRELEIEVRAAFSDEQLRPLLGLPQLKKLHISWPCMSNGLLLRDSPPPVIAQLLRRDVEVTGWNELGDIHVDYRAADPLADLTKLDLADATPAALERLNRVKGLKQLRIWRTTPPPSCGGPARATVRLHDLPELEALDVQPGCQLASLRLEGLPRLTQLRVCGRIERVEIEALPSLARLELAIPRVDAELARAIGRLGTLAELAVFTRDSDESLPECIRGLGRLYKLQLECARLPPEKLQFLRQLQSLGVLELYGVKEPGRSLGFIADLPRLWALGLQRCEAGGTVRLAKAPQLRRLTISDCELDTLELRDLPKLWSLAVEPGSDANESTRPAKSSVRNLVVKNLPELAQAAIAWTNPKHPAQLTLKSLPKLSVLYLRGHPQGAKINVTADMIQRIDRLPMLDRLEIHSDALPKDTLERLRLGPAGR
jgi:HEAT repeat protein